MDNITNKQFFDSQEDTSSHRYIQFLLDDTLFAAPLGLIKEVITLPELTPIPKAPKYFRGLMNLRGHVISVTDLRGILYAENTELDHHADENEKPVVMVIGKGSLTIGIIVNKVSRVLNLTDEQIASSVNIQSKSNLDYVTGIHNEGGQHTTFIDLLKVLKVEDLA